LSQRRRFYEEQGYVLVPGVLPADEVDAVSAEMDAVAETLLARRGSLEASWPGAYRRHVAGDLDPDALRCDSIHDVQRYSARITRLITDPRIVELCVELIGPNVALHHTKYHAKPPETGAPFPLHQDYPHFPHEGHSMMVGALFLDDAHEDNGCLGVVPGSHLRGPLPVVGPDEKYLDPAAYPLESLTLLPAAPGSMLFLNYLTIHGSTPNRATSVRRVLFIQVRDPEDRPTEKTHQSHAQGMMLAGGPLGSRDR
jgi:ectoine hydroxylase-related dioxygenase (phytanoyl-CoA dioxygenase family)